LVGVSLYKLFPPANNTINPEKISMTPRKENIDSLSPRTMNPSIAPVKGSARVSVTALEAGIFFADARERSFCFFFSIYFSIYNEARL